MLETLYCIILIALYILVNVIKKKMINKLDNKGIATINICLDVAIFLGFLLGIALILGFDFSKFKVGFKDFIAFQGSSLIWSIIVVIIASTLLGITKTLLFKSLATITDEYINKNEDYISIMNYNISNLKEETYK